MDEVINTNVNTEETAANPNVLMPPMDADAEMAVLGSIMKDADALADVSEILRKEDFYEKHNQEIYAAILDLNRKDIGVDLMTTYSALKEKKIDTLCGGVTYLSRLVDNAIVSSNAKYYAEIVLAKSRMRQLIKEADAIKSSVYKGGMEPAEILNAAEQRIFEIAQKSQKRPYRPINEILEDNFKLFQKLEENKGQLPGITTGFRDVDKVLGGLKKSDLIILAARPAMGKTSFALNIAQHAAEAGHSVMVFSMEMSDVSLGSRLLSATANVELERMLKGNLDSSDWEALSNAQDSFGDMRLTVDETSALTLNEMKNKCRRRKAEAGLDLIVVDYLQLMSLGYRPGERVQEIAAITRGLKILAKELDCAVLVLSQLSRATEKRSDTVPKLSDLRESGSIEQDADVVMFLHRDEYYDNASSPANINANTANTCDVYISKHRNGPRGKCTLAWVGKYTKFGNLASSTIEEL